MTYSVRFTEAEKEVIVRAAAARGWSPTNLIRQAALETSASIANNAVQPAIKGLALKLAEQVARPRFYLVRAIEEGEDQELTFRVCEEELANPTANSSPYLRILGVEPEMSQLPRETVVEISKAARLGLGEFLRPFIDYTEALSAPDRLDDSRIVAIPAPEE